MNTIYNLEYKDDKKRSETINNLQELYKFLKDYETDELINPAGLNFVGYLLDILKDWNNSDHTVFRNFVFTRLKHDYNFSLVMIENIYKLLVVDLEVMEE